VPRPLADDIRAAILTDIRAGKLSSHAVAKKHGVAQSTVSKLARDAEVTGAFDRSQTIQATHAREADTAAHRANLAARRTALAEALQADAERLRVQLWQPCIYGEFGGKENVWSEVRLDQPRFNDQRQILGSIQAAVNTSVRLVPPADGGADVDDAVSMLTNLAAGIRRIAEQEASSGE
jgi:hypothetical protein